jgi:hypothetical protein
MRDGSVFRLAAETGDVGPLDRPLIGFLEAARMDPIGTIQLQPLLQFEAEGGGHLEPGQLLSAYPPYCSRESANGVSLRAIPAETAVKIEVVP